MRKTIKTKKQTTRTYFLVSGVFRSTQREETLHFNEDGKVIEWLDEFGLRHQYSLDSDGDIYEELIWENGRIVQLIQHYYDEDGRMLFRDASKWEGSADNEFLARPPLCISWDGKIETVKFGFPFEDVYEKNWYDEGGRVVRSKFHADDSYRNYDKYIYRGERKLRSYHACTMIDNGQVARLKKVKHYNDTGLVVREEWSSITLEEGGARKVEQGFEVTDYIYDDEGNWVRQTTRDEKGNLKENNSRIIEYWE